MPLEGSRRKSVRKGKRKRKCVPDAAENSWMSVLLSALVFDSCPSPHIFQQPMFSIQLERRFFLEALIFMVLVADFTTSPGQVDYVAPAAGVFFTTTIQNIVKFAAAAVTTAIVVVGFSTIVIVIVAGAAAAATNRVSKISNQRQLR